MNIEDIVERELEKNAKINLNDLENAVKTTIPDARIGEICKHRAIWLRQQKKQCQVKCDTILIPSWAKSDTILG